MSVEAFHWAWTTRVGNSQRKTLLMGLGGYAHRNGRHAFPSRKTLAEYGECSVKTVDRALGQLAADGFIRVGDQSLVQHIRADRRPIVYDLAMEEQIRLAWQTSATRGDILTPREPDPELEDDLTDTSDRSDNLSPRPRSAVSPRDDAHGATNPDPRGDTAVTPEVTTNHYPPVPPTGWCAAHGHTAHANCRGCSTTSRTAEQQAVREAAERRRAENDRAIQADRAARGRAATAEQRAAAAAEARRLISQTRTAAVR